MSSIKVADRRGGVFQAVIEFTYGECERLPYNLLRRIKAKVDQVPNGGLTAAAEFDLRNHRESALFLEILDLFGEDGSFAHGSAADPAALARVSPPDGENGAKKVAADDDDLVVEGPLSGLGGRR